MKLSHTLQRKTEYKWPMTEIHNNNIKRKQFVNMFILKQDNLGKDRNSIAKVLKR